MTLLTCPRCSRQVSGGKFCPGCGSRIDDPLAGRVLGGKWRLLSAAGKGPHFATFRAEPKSGGVPVAVKILDEGLAEDGERRRRFLENAGAGLALTDGRLLAVREMAEEAMEGGRRAVYAVTDAPAGPSLRDVVARQGPLDPARAGACLRGVLDALGALHGAGAVHGDLHPGCVFLEPDGAGGEQVRLADAGLAPGLASAGPEAEDPSLLGSDGGRWIAPEQAQGQPAGRPADLHAAGALLHFALTGEPPWQAEKGSALLFEIQRSFPRAASEIRPGVPPSVDPILDRAFAKAPAERFGSAAEFARALGAALAGTRAAPVPAYPADVTPGAVVLDAPPAAPAAPAARRGSADQTMTAVASALPSALPADTAPTKAPSGDETLIGTALPPGVRGAPPAKAAPPRGAPAPTAVPPRPAAAAPPPPARPAGKPAGKGAARPTPRPAPAAAEEPPPPTLKAPPPPATEAPAAKPGKVRGAWSVGTPVAVFSILGFLGAGTLYGFAWSGAFDWNLPPWVRTLADRQEIPHPPDGLQVERPKLAPTRLTVTLPAPIRRPLQGREGEKLYGWWRLVKDPAPEAAPGGASLPPRPPSEEPGAAPAEKVYARGEFRGEPDATGALALDFPLPPGAYRLHGTFRFGIVEGKEFKVDGTPVTLSFPVKAHATLLKVRVRQQVGKITVERLAAPPMTKEVRPDEKDPDAGVAVFGGADVAGAPLEFGETVKVKVVADTFHPYETDVVLEEDPHVCEISLKEDPGNKVTVVIKEIEDHGKPSPRYENDAVVLRDPRVLVALARKARVEELWTKVEENLALLRERVGSGTFPEGAAELFAAWHGWLRSRAQAAAARGDVATVRELRGRARPEILASGAAAEERARWAEIEVTGWLAHPPAGRPGAAPEDRELDLVRRMVAEDLPLLRDDVRERLRRDVARRLLDHRAWPAWRTGNELRPPVEGEGKTVPGPAVGPWLELVHAAFPNLASEPAMLVSAQVLAARLEDLERNPENAVRLLVGDPEWRMGKAIPLARFESLTKKDRLLLARALARKGDLLQPTSGADAAKYWEEALRVYEKCTEPDPAGDFSVDLAKAARFEAARCALLSLGSDRAVAYIDSYLKLAAGDAEARALREAVAKQKPLQRPASMEMQKMETIDMPGGVFTVGSGSGTSLPDEEPFRDGRKVPVSVLPARRFRIGRHLVTLREVTKAQYDAYVAEMAKGETARSYFHIDEPQDKKAPGARQPNVENLLPADPVRGVDWWDAYACAKFYGGRLPTEAEWEMMARWVGREEPLLDPMEAFRKALADGGWPGFWPDNPSDVGVFDRAPCGAVGVYGGVAEWTHDFWGRDGKPATPGVTSGLADNVPLAEPRLPKLSEELMAVRGGSYFHRAPGESPGPSLAEEREAAKSPPPPVPAGQAPPPDHPRKWRGMSLLERRGLPAGARPKWVGFRIVVPAEPDRR